MIEGSAGVGGGGGPKDPWPQHPRRDGIYAMRHDAWGLNLGLSQ